MGRGPPPLITLDTSGVLALGDRGEPAHGAAVAALGADRGPYVVPAGIVAEAAFMLEHRLGADALDAFLRDLETGALLLDCGEGDLGRIRALVRRYADLPLGFADSAVVACAERRGGRVLTLDRRHFDVVAREVRLTPVPDYP